MRLLSGRYLRKPLGARRPGARCALPSLACAQSVQCLRRPGPADRPAPFDAPPNRSLTPPQPSALLTSVALLGPRTLAGAAARPLRGSRHRRSKLRRGSPRTERLASLVSRALSPKIEDFWDQTGALLPSTSRDRRSRSVTRELRSLEPLRYAQQDSARLTATKRAPPHLHRDFCRLEYPGGGAPGGGFRRRLRYCSLVSSFKPTISEQHR